VIFPTHPPRSLLAAEAVASFFRGAVAAFSRAQPLRMPTETKLGVSVAAAAAGDLALLAALLTPPGMEPSLAMNPEATS